MKKLATVFIIAVLAPSIALAWLAMRTVREQEFVVMGQQALIYQQETEELAADINVFINDLRLYYGQLVDDLLSEYDSDELTRNFDEILTDRWSQAGTGAVVTGPGEILSPQMDSQRQASQIFLQNNQAFLQNELPAEVFKAAAPKQELQIVKEKAAVGKKSKASSKVAVVEEKLRSNNLKTEEKEDASSSLPFSQSNRTIFNAGQIGYADEQRGQLQELQIGNGLPSGNFTNLSTLRNTTGELADLIGEEPEGAISRFLEDGLTVLLWKRDPALPDRVFWVELDLDSLRRDLSQIIHAAKARNSPVCLALLDENAEPVATTNAEFTTDWRRPFVASELGQLLPQWEVTAYLLDPEAALRSASSARTTVTGLIGLLVLAIGIGGGLIFFQVGREMRLARQKTDFVSNVSHELKTPLTSIRMFSELLAKPTEKQTEYAGVISTETERLTRLINHLLDFSKLDRGEVNYDRVPLDLVALTRQTVDRYRPQLESHEVSLKFIEPASPLQVSGDPDALAQILLNLLSNAEKYGITESREIEIELGANQKTASVTVSDRGPGIPRQASARIFEKFYRVDNSLSTSQQGTGLGLALAREIARAHDGDLTYHPRPDGGSTFTLSIPLLS